MKNHLIAIFVSLLALSCSKSPQVVVRADFSTNKDVYQVGEEVVITNDSEVKGDILAFCKWAFSDGDKTDYQYTIEIDGLSFKTPGTYTIALTAYAEQGAGQDTCTKTIKVIEENDVPWADFKCPSTAKVGEDVLFEDCSIDNVGGIDAWVWNIGGIESRYQSPLIMFDAPQAGVRVELKVVDIYGASSTMVKLIDITE